MEGRAYVARPCKQRGARTVQAVGPRGRMPWTPQLGLGQPQLHHPAAKGSAASRKRAQSAACDASAPAFAGGCVEGWARGSGIPPPLVRSAPRGARRRGRRSTGRTSAALLNAALQEGERGVEALASSVASSVASSCHAGARQQSQPQTSGQPRTKRHLLHARTSNRAGVTNPDCQIAALKTHGPAAAKEQRAAHRDRQLSIVLTQRARSPCAGREGMAPAAAFLALGGALAAAITVWRLRRRCGEGAKPEAVTASTEPANRAGAAGPAAADEETHAAQQVRGTGQAGLGCSTDEGGMGWEWDARKYAFTRSRMCRADCKGRARGRAQRERSRTPQCRAVPCTPPPTSSLPRSHTRPQPVQLARRVFISHTGSDEGAKVFAQSVLKQALDNAGLDTFIDIHNLPPGCDFPERLADAAAHSSVFVAVLVRRPGKRMGPSREVFSHARTFKTAPHPGLRAGGPIMRWTSPLPTEPKSPIDPSPNPSHPTHPRARGTPASSGACWSSTLP
jgi:hypothetical protein